MILRGKSTFSEKATLPFLFLLPFSMGVNLQERVCSSRSKFFSLREDSQGSNLFPLTLLHSERPKLYRVLAILSAIGLRVDPLEMSSSFKEAGSKESCSPW